MTSDPKMLKIKTTDDEIKELKFRTEKHDHEHHSTFKSLKLDNDQNKEKNIKKGTFIYH